MINYDSILSAFDGKPTLLQWLKLVKKALDESVLKDITLKQDGASVIFTFNFEDGTSISTPTVTLPKGDTGAKGDKGEQGVSVTGVDEVSDEVVGSQTLTTLRFHFSNGTNDEVVVYAENGKAGDGKLYMHVSTWQDGNVPSNTCYITTYSTYEKKFTADYVIKHGHCLIGSMSSLVDSNGDTTFDRQICAVDISPVANVVTIRAAGVSPSPLNLTFIGDIVYELDAIL